ncbi:hypothetical protein NKI94_13870 [Mesorhizobium australicum]|uniref:hypothetical protein n=1 Tax=Mesorhizobium australicum TaxID=536018 RepID=UPI00333764FC
MMGMSKVKRTVRTVAFVAAMAASGVAVAGVQIKDLIDAGLDGLCAGFGAAVSKNEGNFTSKNSYGCAGAFQFCPATLVRYFTGTIDAFLTNPKAQVTAWTKYEKDQWGLATTYGLTKLIGTTITYGSKSFVVDRSAILMACQFGCGKFGKLYNYVVKGSDCDSKAVKDGNNVSVCKYLSDGVNKAVSCFTGEGDLFFAENKPKADPSSSIPIVAANGGPVPPVQKVDNGPNGESSNTASCSSTALTGKGSFFELVEGKYTLRFQTGTTPDDVGKILDVIDRRTN